MKLEPVIGLEIHVQLKTKSKMFCSCANVSDSAEPNSAICPICLGYPGTLPAPNRRAIEWIQLVGAALNCELATHSKFDRKHYFYPDLPKGYQISQFDQPFCGPGSLSNVGITRAHLEEDAAKNIHPKGANHTLVDYNRAGTPLVEIVTEPDIKSPAQAKSLLQELQRIVRALKVSDADMEKGQLRCDANISLREGGDTSLNPKTEIKNLNSFRNVERALTYEIQRQSKLFEQGNIPTRETTRGFNADTGQTTAQRQKEGASDYRYFPEPDIPPFVFTNQELKQRMVDLPELPHHKRERFIRQFGLSDQHANLLSEQPGLADFTENVISELQQLANENHELTAKDVKQLVPRTVNLIIRDLRSLLISQDVPIADLKISAANFAELVVLIYQSKINQSVVVTVLEQMQATGGDPDHIIAKAGLAQTSDAAELESIVKTVIAENPNVVDKIKSGKNSARQFLFGQIMAKTKGTAKPDLIIQLLDKLLSDQ